MFLFYLCIFFTATNYNCYSEEPDDNIIIYEESFRILCHANILYMNNNEQTTAFFCLFENENAINIFIELLGESETGVGIFYALLGLFEHDEDLYYEILKTIDLSTIIRVRSIRSSDVTDWYTLDELRIMIESGRSMSNLKINRLY